MTFPADFPASFVNYYTQEDAATKSVTRFYANAVALQAAQVALAVEDLFAYERRGTVWTR